MVVGFAGVSLIDVTTCVCLWFQYQQFIGGAVMQQLQDGFACVNLCSRGVCVSKHHMHATHISMQFWSTYLNRIKGGFANMRETCKILLQIWEKHGRYRQTARHWWLWHWKDSLNIVMYHHVTTIWQILTGWNTWLLLYSATLNYQVI
jgi:hypothetical protein